MTAENNEDIKDHITKKPIEPIKEKKSKKTRTLSQPRNIYKIKTKWLDFQNEVIS